MAGPNTFDQSRARLRTEVSCVNVVLALLYNTYLVAPYPAIFCDATVAALPPRNEVLVPVAAGGHLFRIFRPPPNLQFPNTVALNAIGRRNTQMTANMSAKERRAQKSAKERKRAQKSSKWVQKIAKERKRAHPRKNCKQPGLGTPNYGPNKQIVRTGGFPASNFWAPGIGTRISLPCALASHDASLRGLSSASGGLVYFVSHRLFHTPMRCLSRSLMSILKMLRF